MDTYNTVHIADITMTTSLPYWLHFGISIRVRNSNTHKHAQTEGGSPASICLGVIQAVQVQCILMSCDLSKLRDLLRIVLTNDDWNRQITYSEQLTNNDWNGQITLGENLISLNPSWRLDYLSPRQVKVFYVRGLYPPLNFETRGIYTRHMNYPLLRQENYAREGIHYLHSMALWHFLLIFNKMFKILPLVSWLLQNNRACLGMILNQSNIDN